jgi:hypothetical protein
MFPALLGSVVVPILTDFIKTSAPSISRKVFGVSVDEQIKMNEADIERLKALATLDTPGGTPSQWVVDLRASFRYIAAAALILSGVGLAILGLYAKSPETLAIGIDLASSPFGFIFGERLVLSYKANGK